MATRHGWFSQQLRFCFSQNEMSNIGTQKFFLPWCSHNSTHKAPPELIPELVCTKFSVDKEFDVKTRFKGFCDIFSKICMRPWFRRCLKPNFSTKTEAYKSSALKITFSTFAKNVISNIGTKILFLPWCSHNSTHKAPPELIPELVCTKFSVDSEIDIKT